jgi:hypothetical protein
MPQCGIAEVGFSGTRQAAHYAGCIPTGFFGSEQSLWVEGSDQFVRQHMVKVGDDTVPDQKYPSDSTFCPTIHFPPFFTNYYPTWKIYWYSLETKDIVHLNLLFKAILISLTRK